MKIYDKFAGKEFVVEVRSGAIHRASCLRTIPQARC
jgi:hypothetical protein